MHCNQSHYFCFLILASGLTNVDGQFEFQNSQAALEIISTTVRVGEISCVVILRPTRSNPLQYSAIERLTFGIAKNFQMAGTRKPTVMSYTTARYIQFYMNVDVRKRDSCIHWITIVMASDSTPDQLAMLSKSDWFRNPYWLIFINGTTIKHLTQNTTIKVDSNVFVVEEIKNDTFSMTLVNPRKTGAKRQFIWSKVKGVITNYDYRQMNLEGFSLKVGTVKFPPYVMVNRAKNGTIRSVYGYYGSLWNDLQQALKFKCKYVEPPDGLFGSLDQYGNVSGLFGKLVRNEIDIILADLTLTQPRSALVEFLHPIERTVYKIFYRMDSEVFDWFKVFRPLNYYIWSALLIWLIIGGIASYIVTNAATIYEPEQKHTSFITGVYFLLRTLSNQGCDKVPKSWAPRIFFLTAYLLAAIILPSYSAALISALAQKTPMEPFRDMKDILATDYKLITRSSTADYDFLTTSTDPIHSEIGQKNLLNDQQLNTYTAVIKHVCDTKKTVLFGAFSEIVAVYHHHKLSCPLAALKSDISSVYKSMALTKFSQYGQLFRYHLLKMMEFGLAKRHQHRYIRHNYDPEVTEIAISLIDVGAIFIFLGILQVLSVFIFCLEYCYWKYHHSGGKLQRNQKRYKTQYYVD